MTPYYESKDVIIHCGRWEDVLPQLNVLADVIITDPPYEETNLDWDTADHGWLNEVSRRKLLCRRGSIWVFGSMRYLFNLWREMIMNDFRFAQEVIWEKHNGSNSAADRFRRVHELCAQWYTSMSGWKTIYKNPLYELAPGRKSVVRRQKVQHWSKIGESQYHRDEGGKRLVRSVIKVKSCHGEAVWPTQKPLELVKHLAAYSCPPGGLILDMHMGSGTTLVAARELGMRAIGIEREEKACALAVARLTK